MPICLNVFPASTGRAKRLTTTGLTAAPSWKQVVIEQYRAQDVNFREGDFRAADFRATGFANSLFSRTNLSDADFSEAINYNIDLQANTVTGAIFSRYEAVRLLESLGIELVD